MKGNYRLTVHLADQPKVDTRAPKRKMKKGAQKTAIDMAREEARKSRSNTTQESNKGRFKVYTTISSYHMTMEDCMKRLNDIKSKYTIQLGNDHNKVEKYGKELYNISFVN